MRDTSPAALSSLQASNQQVVDQIVKELDSQAHFVSYAPPKFVAFRQGIYLRALTEFQLPASDAGSRCKLAAMAFDDHVAHIIRFLLARRPLFNFLYLTDICITWKQVSFTNGR